MPSPQPRPCAAYDIVLGFNIDGHQRVVTTTPATRAFPPSRSFSKTGSSKRSLVLELCALLFVALCVKNANLRHHVPGLSSAPSFQNKKWREKEKLSKELTIFSQELSRSRLRDLINDLDFAQRLVLDLVIRHELFEIRDERLFAARSIRRPRRRRDDISYTRQKDEGREPKGFSSREPSCVFSFSFLPFGASPRLSSGMPMTATSCTSGCDNR